MTIIGIIIAIIFGIFSVYVVYAENPEITFDIINDANVLDVHKPLTGLNIYYQGEDIQQQNQNLRIVSIKVENTGNVNILQNYYDENVVWGLNVENGYIIESRLVDSNSDYLFENFKLDYNEDTIEFQKVILEPSKFFIIEVLILHDKDVGIKYKPLGKIAGIEQINLQSSYMEERSFLEEVFDGSVLVQLVRLLFYLIIWIVLVLLLVALTEIIDYVKENRRKSKKRKLVNKLDSTSIQNEDIVKSILLCIPLNKWNTVFDSLKEYKFDQNTLKNCPVDYFDKICNKLSGKTDFIDLTVHLVLASNNLLPTMENSILAVGSHLFENKMLEENTDTDGVTYFKVKDDFLSELQKAIDYLQMKL